MLEFEWDEQKARANLAKHGVHFADASAVFRDPFAIDSEDRSMSYDEIRRNVTGIAGGMVLTVVYTERNATIRVISARKATRAERLAYENAE